MFQATFVDQYFRKLLMTALLIDMYLQDIESHTGFRVVLPMHRGKSLLPIEEVKDEITGESAVFLDVGFCSGFCPTTHRSPYDHV